MPAPKKGVAYTFDVVLIDASNRPSLRVNPTLASGDIQVSKDEGAFAPVATVPSVAPAGSAQVKIDLSATEMNADRLGIRIVDVTSPKEWDDLYVFIETTAVTVDDLVRSATPANLLTVDVDGRTKADVERWKNAAPNDLITGRVDANAQVVGDKTGYTLTSGERNDVADALLKRDWTAIVGDPPARSMWNALRFLRNLWEIIGTILHVKKEDDLTDAWTSTLTTTPGADPITKSDPT